MNELQNNNNGLVEEQEIYVTNAAIKATDVLKLVGATAFAGAGIGACYHMWKKKRADKINADYKAKLIDQLIKDGHSPEEIEICKKILNK